MLKNKFLLASFSAMLILLLLAGFEKSGNVVSANQLKSVQIARISPIGGFGSGSSQSSSTQQSGSAVCSDWCPQPYTSLSQVGCSYTYTYNTLETQELGGTITCSNKQTINTKYVPNTYSLSSSISGSYTYSPANQVNATNSQTAVNLLICPLSGSISPGQDYFVPNEQEFPYVAGDACSSTATSLSTQINLPLTVTWSDTQLASAQVGSMQMQNPASVNIQLLAMSPLLNGNTIANGYASQTYIFTGVPSVAQHAVWSWSAAFADFGLANLPNILTVNLEPQIVNIIIPNGDADSNFGSASESTMSKSSNVYLTPTLSQCRCGDTNLVCVGTTISQVCSGCPSSCPPVSKSVYCNGEPYSAYTCQSTTTTSTSTSTTSTSTTSTSTTILPCTSGEYSEPMSSSSSSSLCSVMSGITVYAYYSCSTGDIISECEPSPTNTCQPSGCTPTPPTTTTTTTTTSSTTTTSTTTTTIEYQCTYKYPYSATLTLKNIKNTYIPFTEVVPPEQALSLPSLPGTSMLPEPGLQTYTFNAPVLPYFLMQYQLPSPGDYQLKNSYDIFSPWNYATPANSIDTFPIDTPSRFFVNYTGTLVSMPSNTVLNSKDFGNAISKISNALNNMQNGKGAISALQSVLSMLNVPTPYISNPISVAAIPNDYVFVLNGTNGNYNLTVIRLVPKGYYNSTNYAPTSVSSTTSQAAWDQEWDNYWSNDINLENETAYVVASYNLNNLIGQGFIPYNITADDAGDVFITVAVSSGGPGEIIGLLNAISGSPTVISSNTFVNNLILPEIAATPTGDMLFAATPSQGYIYAFNFTPTGINFAPTGNISLAFNTTNPSGQDIMLNITQYLYDGGLYGVAFNGINAPNVLIDNQMPNNYFDRPSLHHPLGIADAHGYLYVLDEWTIGGSGFFGITQPTTKFNILLLRVINSTGFNVPINPTKFNDMWTATKCEATINGKPVDLRNSEDHTLSSNQPPSGLECTPSSLCTPEATQVNNEPSYYEWSCVANTATGSKTAYSLAVISNTTFPPYGWPISANVTVNGNKVTFCSSSQCTYTPSSLPSDYTGGYAPIGPALHAYFGFTTAGYGFPTAGFSINYNDTVNLLLKKTKICTGAVCLTPIYYPQYTELITATRVNVQNYTKMFAGEPPYTCYVDNSLYTGACQYLDSLKHMWPPVYTVSDPFKYVENIGATRSLTFVGQLNSVSFVTSSGSGSSVGIPSIYAETKTPSTTQGDIIYAKASNSKDYVTIYVNGQPVATDQGFAMYTICSAADPCTAGSSINVYAEESQQSGGQGPESSTLTIMPQSGAPSYPNQPLQAPPIGTSLSAQITGSLLVPYAYTYELDQQTGSPQLISAIALNSQGQPISSSSSAQQKANTLCLNNEPNIQTSSSQEETIYTYAVVNSQSNQLQTIVENADTYLEDMYNQLLYVPNLEDTIMPPNIFYYLRNNRLFGYLYMNQTAPNGIGKTAYGTDLKIYTENRQSMLANQRLYTYEIEQYTQQYSEGSAPAYEQIVSVPTSSSSSSSSSLSYSPSQTPNYITLFDFYQQLSYLSRFTVNMGTALGFQLFDLMFNDRFNNTIFAPLPLDIANPVEISMQVNPQPLQTNGNQTTIYITGNVYVPSQTAGGAPTPLSNAKIYLYYGKNINFLDYDALTDPVNAMICAFGAPAIAYQNLTKISIPANMPTNCTLANPDWVGLQQNANTITYHAQFASSGTCSPPPNSLLEQNYRSCNIFNQFDLSATCPNTGTGEPEYCEPIYVNGTGICTSQIGLMAIVTTDSNGGFSYTTTACGSGSNLGSTEIVAQYYGSPVQPLTAELLPISLQANDVNLAEPYPNYLTVNELNYYYAPNETAEQITIGEPMLSVGNISLATLAFAGIGIALLLIYKASHSRRLS